MLSIQRYVEINVYVCQLFERKGLPLLFLTLLCEQIINPIKGKIHFKTFFADSDAEYVVVT